MFASNLLQHPTHPNFAYICIFQSRSLIPAQQTPDFVNKPNNHTRHSLQLLHLLPGSFPDLLSTFRAPFSALYCLVITPVFKMSVRAVLCSLQGTYTDERQISWRKKSQRNEFENGVALNSSFK